MVQDIVVIGRPPFSFAREVVWAIEEINKYSAKWNILGFVSDVNVDQYVNGYPVIGNTDWLKKYDKPINAIFGFSDFIVKKDLIKEFSVNENIRYPNIVAPDVKQSRFVEYGEGCVICSGTIMTVNISIGSHVVINLDCTIGHDAVIKDFCVLAPSVNISGNVSLDEGVYVGTGANIIEKVSIGANTTIGAGAVVIKDIPMNCVAVGSPAKPIKFKNAL